MNPCHGTWQPTVLFLSVFSVRRFLHRDQIRSQACAGGCFGPAFISGASENPMASVGLAVGHQFITLDPRDQTADLPQAMRRFLSRIS